MAKLGLVTRRGGIAKLRLVQQWHSLKGGEILDEGIKRIFRRHFNQLRECAENTQTRKTIYSYAMEEIADLYADVCGITYDTAAAELHSGENDDEEGGDNNAGKRNAAE